MHDGMPYDRNKVKVKVTSVCKPLNRSRPSVTHGTNFSPSFTINALCVKLNKTRVAGIYEGND